MPCDDDGEYLNPEQLPSPRNPNDDPTDWWPYENHFSFELAKLLYCKACMSITYTNLLLWLWSQIAIQHGKLAPFICQADTWGAILSTVDAWYAHCFFLQSSPSGLRKMLANPDYQGCIDYAPTQVFDKNKDQQYRDLMTGNWSWDQAVRSCLHML